MDRLGDSLTALRLLVEYQTTATLALIQVKNDMEQVAQDPAITLRLSQLEHTQAFVADCLDALKG
jgi:hypothetical protein